MKKHTLIVLLIISPFIISLTSCVSTKSTTYFNNAVDTTFLSNTLLSPFTDSKPSLKSNANIPSSSLLSPSSSLLSLTSSSSSLYFDSSININKSILDNSVNRGVVNDRQFNEQLDAIKHTINNGSLNTIGTYSNNLDLQNIHIQKNDILSISITSLNQEASALFNTTNNFIINASTSSGSNTQATGYLVNNNGYIQLPILGYIQASGLTKEELKEKLTEILVNKQLLIDPIVNIRHINYEVTVIGEVGRPGVISVPNEKISFLKALGLAGDITIYGRKDNVLLIREIDGIKNIKYINLNSKDFLTSPYYYLYPNDIIYVASNKNKVASVGNSTRLLPVFLSGLSFFILLIDRVVF